MDRVKMIRAAVGKVSNRDAKLALAHIRIQAMEEVAYGYILRLDGERFERVLGVLRGFRRTERGTEQRRREDAAQQRMCQQALRRGRPQPAA